MCEGRLQPPTLRTTLDGHRDDGNADQGRDARFEACARARVRDRPRTARAPSRKRTRRHRRGRVCNTASAQWAGPGRHVPRGTPRSAGPREVSGRLQVKKRQRHAREHSRAMTRAAVPVALPPPEGSRHDGLERGVPSGARPFVASAQARDGLGVRVRRTRRRELGPRRVAGGGRGSRSRQRVDSPGQAGARRAAGVPHGRRTLMERPCASRPCGRPGKGERPWRQFFCVEAFACRLPRRPRLPDPRRRAAAPATRSRGSIAPAGAGQRRR